MQVLPDRVPRAPDSIDVSAELLESTRARVASHYDDLDPFYRDLWGQHVHHGLWRTGREDPETAVRQLVDLVAAKGAVDGARVCDVGCGYGGTSRILAREYDAQVTAFTVSARQFEYASRVDPGSANPAYRLQDWLRNDLPAASIDTVIAIESVSHMADRGLFFRQAYRVLRPGGRLVACIWMAGETVSARQRRHLLDPICREGCLTGLVPSSRYRAHAEAAGLEVEETTDLSRSVRRTWAICIRRGLRRLPSAAYRRFFFDRGQANRQFALSLFRIWLGYRTGALRYGLLVARKPEGEAGPSGQNLRS